MYSVYNELGYGEVMRYIKSRLAEGTGVAAASPLGVSVDECDVKGCIGPVSSRSASSSGGSPPPPGGSSVSSISPVQFPTNGRPSTQPPAPPPFGDDLDDLRDFLLPPPPPPPPLPAADSSTSASRGYATLNTSNLSHLNCRAFGGPHSPASSSDAVSQICVIGSPSVGSDSGFQGEEDSVSNVAAGVAEEAGVSSSSSSFPFDEVSSSTQPSVRIVLNEADRPSAQKSMEEPSEEEEEEFIDVEAVEPESVEADSTSELPAVGFASAESPDTTAVADTEWPIEEKSQKIEEQKPLIPLIQSTTTPHRKSALITPIRLRLDSSSDLDSTLSPNSSAFSPVSAKSIRSPRKFRSSALHSPTDAAAPETPTLSAKTRRVTHEIEASRRRVLKYVANNLRSAALLMHWRRRVREAEEEQRGNEAASFRPNLEDPADDPAFGILREIPEIRPVPKPKPQPLNLYPNGDEKVFGDSKTDPKAEAEMMAEKSRIDAQINAQISAHAEAENRLMSVLLIPLKPRPAEAPLTGVSDSTDTTESKPIQPSVDCPSRRMERLLADAQRQIPRLGGIGRHTMAKYRALFRAELSSGNAWQQSTQLDRIRERRLREQQKLDDAARKRQQHRSKRPPHSATRRRGHHAATKRSSTSAALSVASLQRKPSAAGPIVKRHSSGSVGFRRSTKSSSTIATPTTATPTSALLTPTTALFPNIAALARDPTFDSFLTPPAEAASPGDPYSFAEAVNPTETDPFHRAATQLFALAQQLRRGSGDQTPTTIQPKKRGRKPSADSQRKPRRPSNASSGQPKAKRQRKTREPNNNTIPSFVETDAAKSEGMLVYTAETEESCAFPGCSLPRVLVVTGAEPTEWVQCDRCDGWFHCVCVWGLNRAVGEDEKFQCDGCRH